MSPDRRLFWFLKEGASLDLSDRSDLEMYLQQVMTHGRAEDVRAMLKTIHLKQLRGALGRMKRFLPTEVSIFWEDFVGSNQ